MDLGYVGQPYDSVTPLQCLLYEWSMARLWFYVDTKRTHAKMR